MAEKVKEAPPKGYGAPAIALFPLKAAPLPAVVMLCLALISGITPTLQVLATAWFINSAIAIIQTGAPSGSAMTPMVLLAATVCGQGLVNVFNDLAKSRLRLGLRAVQRTRITARRAELNYAHIEDSDSWDLISRVSKEPEVTLTDGYANLMSMLLSGMKLVGLFGLLIAQVWWAALLIVGFSVPLLMLAVKAGKNSYDAQRETTKTRRTYEYLSEVMLSREATEERAVFGYTGKLNALYRLTFDKAYRVIFRTQAKEFVRLKLGGVIMSLISSLMALTLIPPTLSGALTVGMFISLLGALIGLIQEMSWGVAWMMQQLATHREYLRDVGNFDALSRDARWAQPPASPAPEFHSLELRDVRFTYPGSETPVLNGLSMKLHTGMHYAFVGLNGAGKTTITKLLTGLYPQFEGEILINDRPIAEYPPEQLKAMFSVVYQDFARYSVSLYDNIAIGRAADMNGSHTPVLEDAVARAIDQTDLQAVIDKLPQGLDTPLGKIDDSGQDLSGGEWQKVAMARAVASPAPVRILDEPTAALDPISESRVYESFERISRGTTTLFISHRLGSTMLADEIFVIGEGRVLEQGTHDGLFAAGGQYARMYESQRSWYQ